MNDVATDQKERYKYAADQAAAVLAGQRADLTGFQTRCQAVLSSSAITTTIIGAVSKAVFTSNSDKNLLSDWELAVIAVLFALTAIAALAGMWPRKGWQYQPEPKAMIALYDAYPDATDAAVYRNAADSMVTFIEENVTKLNKSVLAVRTAQVLLVLQILFFLGVIISRTF